MPLSEKARIEAYLPDLPVRSDQNLLAALEEEFTHTFGGCTLLRGLDGRYLSRIGGIIRDRIALLYTDTPFGLSENRQIVTRYADSLQSAVMAALDEEAILIAVVSVWHVV